MILLQPNRPQGSLEEQEEDKAQNHPLSLDTHQEHQHPQHLPEWNDTNEHLGVVNQAEDKEEERGKGSVSTVKVDNSLERNKAPTITTEAYVTAEVAKLQRTCRLFQGREIGGETFSWDFYQDQLAIFRRNEIHTSKLLGSGAFSEVYQIRNFQPHSCPHHQLPVFHSKEEHKRDKIALSATDKHGNGRYVLKHLRHDLLHKTKKFQQAAADLVSEAMYLTKFNHPNIINIRAWAGGPSAFANGSYDDFFLILDRIDETLTCRIVRWIVRERKMVARTARNPNKKDLTLYGEKINIALQIAQGLDYLHRNEVVYRDLKPDNVGIQKGGRVQIFDFGMCREIPEANPDPDTLFHMSAVGTRVFMAPEALAGQPYNLKADVYSWTILFHTMLSLRKPYESYDANEHRQLVCEHSLRPDIDPEWPEEIQTICRKGWTGSPSERPSMKGIVTMLQDVQSKIRSIESQMMSSVEPELIEGLSNLMDACSLNLCGGSPSCGEDTNVLLNERAIEILRFLEMHMLDGMSVPIGGAGHLHYNHHSDKSSLHSHFQLLRSHYL